MIVTIERLGHLGDGIGKDGDGRPVFVPMALPGEVVEGDDTGGRIERPKILRPSDERVAAPCPHYRACGGCALMHARDGFVASWKTAVVEQALAAHDLEAPMRPIATSPPRSRRRAAFSARRTKSGAIAGFHARASDTLIEVPGCILVTTGLAALSPDLAALALLGGSRKGELTVTASESDGGMDIAVEGGKPLDQSLFSGLAAHAEAAGWARISWNGEVAVTRHAARQRFGPVSVVPPPGAFLQATREGEAALAAAVGEATEGAAEIADLFAGCGTFALPFTARASVHAAEGSEAMVQAMVAGWRETGGLHRLSCEARDLYRRPILADELARFDAVVIDPPRAGAETQMHEIAASSVSRVAAVSCNPVTFARDARVLCDAGFRLDWVQPVDQFRWSPHVEIAACFSR